MFKYLRQWFHEAFLPNQQFVAISEIPAGQIVRNEEESIARENIGNETDSRIINSLRSNDRSHESSRVNDMDHVNPHEPAIRLGAKKSWLQNCTTENFSKKEEKNKKFNDFCENQNRDSNKEKILLKDTNEAEEKNCRNDYFCACKNCSTIAEISECGVCLEPLQTRGVRSCPLCANIVCSDCASRLKKCAFCRISLPMQKNLAIERLLAKLSLPCRNARSGCQKLLKSEMRLKHEASCDYASITCPVLRGSCSWQGSPTEVLTHLKQVHNLKPLASRGIAVEVANFRVKCIAKLGECTVYLTCYSQLFAVKVSTFRKKLMLQLVQLGYVGPVTEESVNINYGVWIRIKSVGGKSIRGVLPFGKFDRETREIEINSDRLFSKRASKFQDVEDTVNIEISIREIDHKL